MKYHNQAAKLYNFEPSIQTITELKRLHSKLFHSQISSGQLSSTR